MQDTLTNWFTARKVCDYETLLKTVKFSGTQRKVGLHILRNWFGVYI